MRRIVMRPNHSTAGPSHIITFDTETRPKRYGSRRGQQLHLLRLGVAKYVRIENGEYTRRDVCRFTEADTFWEFVESKQHARMPLWVFAHNLAFDLTTCNYWDRVQQGIYYTNGNVHEETEENESGFEKRNKPGFMLLEDPPTVMNMLHCDGSRVIFCDTMNYFTTSLAKMGEMLGLPKMKMPKFSAPDSEWWPYCENDVDITEGAVLGLVRWVKEHEMGKFRYTAPAQAMAAFRHKFMKLKPECHMEPDVRQLERESYYGGRLENFYIGPVKAKRANRVGPATRRRPVRTPHPVGPVYELDVASLYPFVMAEYEYPWKLVTSSFERKTVGNWKKRLAGDCIARVYLDTTHQFPFREARVGTVYPVGRYWTTLCGPELQRALDLGVVKDCSAWSQYRLGDLFSSFVTELWSMRHAYEASENTLYAGLCKLIMVSLYGKFGQLGAEWKDRPQMQPPTEWGTWAITGRISGASREFRIVGGLVQERIEADEIPTAFPAIAAYVTAYGREYLADLREVAGRNNVYYLVTDALYVNQQGYDNLASAGFVADRELGKLTVKHVGRSADFECLHHLRVGDMVKRGSVKSHAKQVGHNQWEETHFQGLRAIIAGRRELKRVINPKTGEEEFHDIMLPPLPGVLTFPLVKTFSKVYNRGYKQPDGWVAPLVLEMERKENVATSSSSVVPETPQGSGQGAGNDRSRRRKGSQASGRVLAQSGKQVRSGGSHNVHRRARRRKGTR